MTALQRYLIFFMLICMFCGSVYANDSLIYTSRELTIKNTVASTLSVPSGIASINVDVTFFPQNSFRQEILEQTYDPQATQSQNAINFKWNNPQVGTHDFSIETIVQTQNIYLPIKTPVRFPITQSAIPSEYQKYLSSSNNIDINQQITHQASLLADGKDDLFTISHDIAQWIEQNIQYDLSTITADVSQSASWTLTNKKGVCDELTSLFIAMMRSLGVPARFVSGVSYTNSPLFTDKWGPHAWAEVYFPGYGWVPFDITYRQFGHIDASHIQLKVSDDAQDSYTKYSWSGRGNKVQLDPLHFETEILQTSDKIEDDVQLKVQPLYGNIGFESSNVLIVELENVQDYYVSVPLSFASPSEIVIAKNDIVLLKPKEKITKSYTFSVGELDARYSYTMPFEIQTLYGESAKTSVVVARHHPSYSKNQINDIQTSTQTSGTIQVDVNCQPEPYAFVNETFLLSCLIHSNGNTYLQDAVICVENNCSTHTIPIGQKISIESYKKIESVGTMLIPVTIRYNGNIFHFQSPIAVNGIPTFDIDVKYTQNISYEQTTPFEITLSPQSGGIAQDISVKVYSGIDPTVYSIPLLDRSYVLQGDITGKELVPGKNSLSIVLSYNDIGGRTYTKTVTYDVVLEEPTATQKIAIWLRRTLRQLIQ